MVSNLSRAAIAAACLLFFSYAYAHKNDLAEWQKYSGYTGMRGLHVKPVLVTIDGHGFAISGKRMSDGAVFQLLRKSRNLSPRPDILVRADHGELATARRFMKRVSHAGMCEGRKCLYTIAP